MTADPTPATCPACGLTLETGCVPSKCPAWSNTAIYDHERREWLPVDADGFVLDGRRAEDVR